MKAVMPEVPPDIFEWRRRTGAERWDEMWEGVLHIVPSPNRVQQDLEAELETWLRPYWARPGGNKVYHQINVASPGGWPNDYRIPDLVLLTPERFHIDHDEYFEGPPTAVVEIRSPGDETYEKLAFYAKLGVPEVWVIDRNTKAPELHVLHEDRYETLTPDAEGWLVSRATSVRLRAVPGDKVALQITGDESTQRIVPEQ